MPAIDSPTRKVRREYVKGLEDSLKFETSFKRMNETDLRRSDGTNSAAIEDRIKKGEAKIAELKRVLDVFRKPT